MSTSENKTLHGEVPDIEDYHVTSHFDDINKTSGLRVTTYL